MMRKFLSEWKLPIIILAMGLPILYCEVMWMSRAAAKAGCHQSLDYDGSYQAHVFCNNKADAISWGWKADFEGFGKVYTWDKAAEIYVIKETE